MFVNKKLAILVVLVMIAPIVLAACAPTPEPEIVVETVVETVQVEVTKIVEGETVVETIVETVEVEVVETVEVEITPTPAPTERKGGWLDMIVYLEEPSASAGVTRLNVGELDIYSYGVSEPDVYDAVQGMEGIDWAWTYGSYNDLTFNPCAVEGQLNPFSSQKLREAMHWLVDRDYVVQEIFAGLAAPKYTSFGTAFAEYGKTAATHAVLETKYAYDPDKAKEVIAEEMQAMGAELVDGKWTFNGEPVTIIFLIRVEDLRRDIGDYVSNQLEDAGLTVDRQYKTSAEAATLWVQSDPCELGWHAYTGGWIANFLSRDDAGDFDFFFTQRGYPIPLWQAYQPDEPLDICANRLNLSDFGSLEERGGLIDECLVLGNEFAVRIFVNDRKSFWPKHDNVEVAADLAAGVAGGRMNPFAMRFKDQVGGAMTIAMPSFLTEPWNSLGGSNWLYDAAIQRPTQDYGMMTDPFTGLRVPQRIERAEVYVQEGLPVGRGGDSEDWLTLEYVPEIVVPDDAWADWDAENQVFITAGEKFTETQTVAQKTVVYYPSELYETTWHDGSNFSIGDVVMYMIMHFDRGKPESAVYDASLESSVVAFMEAFKGVKIVSEDPLVIETYSDAYALEAELLDQNEQQTWYPRGGNSQSYPFGTASWHYVALGYRPEAAGELGWSASKADELEVEWMNTVGGPSLEILAGHLVSATAENFLPYAPTLSQFISEEEIATRWANYSQWYDRRGHFHIGTGPYYLEGAFPLEGTVIVRQYDKYIDNADRWAGFTTPKIAVAEIDGPGRVDIGAEAAFDVFVTFEGEPYPADEIASVTYLVFDAGGNLVAQDDAEFVSDGQYQIMLSSDLTSGLEAGANKLQAVVVSKLVAIPTFESFEFVSQ
jgi:peptide/nickel transport system substrate-binding protein